jgi:hypothetical protein
LARSARRSQAALSPDERRSNAWTQAVAASQQREDTRRAELLVRSASKNRSRECRTQREEVATWVRYTGYDLSALAP